MHASLIGRTKFEVKDVHFWRNVDGLSQQEVSTFAQLHITVKSKY